MSENVLNDLKTKAWNNCISSRLPAVHSMFASDSWQKGVGEYIRVLDKQGMDKLLSGCKTRDDDQFMRGFISALRQISDLPDVVKRQIDKPEQPQPGTYTG